MNWEGARMLHRGAWLAFVSVMLEIAGLVPGGSVDTLPRFVRSKILNPLRPSESAGHVGALCLVSVCAVAVSGHKNTAVPLLR